MALQRNWDPKSPHGRMSAGDGLYESPPGTLNIGGGWGIIVTEDGVAVDQALLDARYIEVEISTTQPTAEGIKIWINPDENLPLTVDPATKAVVEALHAEMAALRQQVASLR